jgi:hypothetical protein
VRTLAYLLGWTFLVLHTATILVPDANRDAEFYAFRADLAAMGCLFLLLSLHERKPAAPESQSPTPTGGTT